MRTNVTILLRPNASPEQTAAKLRTFGVFVERVMPILRMIAGSVESSKIGALKELPEVQAVEKERYFHVSPVDD